MTIISKTDQRRIADTVKAYERETHARQLGPGNRGEGHGPIAVIAYAVGAIAEGGTGEARLAEGSTTAGLVSSTNAADTYQIFNPGPAIDAGQRILIDWARWRSSSTVEPHWVVVTNWAESSTPPTVGTGTMLLSSPLGSMTATPTTINLSQAYNSLSAASFDASTNRVTFLETCTARVEISLAGPKPVSGNATGYVILNTSEANAIYGGHLSNYCIFPSPADTDAAAYHHWIVKGGKEQYLSFQEYRGPTDPRNVTYNRLTILISLV
jgi:hypothetical protein